MQQDNNHWRRVVIEKPFGHDLESAKALNQQVRQNNVVVNHDDSPMGASHEKNPGVFVRSVYFTDPNGIMMEFAATTRAFGPDDVRHAPAAAGAEL